jgi:hypothetical protein
MDVKRHVGFEAPVDLIEALQEIAAREERTVSAQLRTMIREHVTNEGNARQSTPSVSENRAGMEQPAGDQV